MKALSGSPDLRPAARWLTLPLLGAIRVYQWTISPMLHLLVPGGGCRYQPSCSRYAYEALRVHGPIAGTWLAIKRLARCHPWGGCGHDPVPPRQHRQP